MPVSESDIRASWRGLPAGSDSGWRRVLLQRFHNCEIHVARRSPENLEAVLFELPGVPLPAERLLPRGQGFRVEKISPGEDQPSWLALVRTPDGSLDLFAHMAADLVTAVSLASGARSSGEGALKTILSRLQAWQEFMRRGQRCLSPAEELGLFGELSLLWLLLDAGVPDSTVLDAWRGPLHGLHDFELGSGSVEVKSTLAAEGFPVRIDSLEQLDDSLRQPLMLAGMRLCLSEDGRTLPRLVAALRIRLQADPHAMRMLETALLHAGYQDSDAASYGRQFALVHMEMLRVDEGFPRLVPASVPLGILNARYEIDLSLVDQERLELSAALMELGVF